MCHHVHCASMQSVILLYHFCLSVHRVVVLCLKMHTSSNFSHPPTTIVLVLLHYVHVDTVLKNCNM